MWQPSDFTIATTAGPETKSGYIYRDLGLHIARETQVRREPVWVLTHLNTGHAVAEIRGCVADAFPIATTIAECTEWDFSSLEGWRERDPALAAKVFDILAASKGRARKRSASRANQPDEAAARAVLLKRGV